MAYADDPAPTTPGAEPVTVEGLLQHFNKYGLDNSHTGYRGKAERYTGYGTLRTDSLVHTARTFLSERAYLHLLEAIGYAGLDKAASIDWRQAHNIEEDADGKQA